MKNILFYLILLIMLCSKVQALDFFDIPDTDSDLWYYCYDGIRSADASYNKDTGKFIYLLTNKYSDLYLGEEDKDTKDERYKDARKAKKLNFDQTKHFRQPAISGTISYKNRYYTNLIAVRGSDEFYLGTYRESTNIYDLKSTIQNTDENYIAIGNPVNIDDSGRVFGGFTALATGNHVYCYYYTYDIIDDKIYNLGAENTYCAIENTYQNELSVTDSFLSSNGNEVFCYIADCTREHLYLYKAVYDLSKNKTEMTEIFSDENTNQVHINILPQIYTMPFAPYDKYILIFDTTTAHRYLYEYNLTKNNKQFSSFCIASDEDCACMGNVKSFVQDNSVFFVDCQQEKKCSAARLEAYYLKGLDFSFNENPTVNVYCHYCIDKQQCYRPMIFSNDVNNVFFVSRTSEFDSSNIIFAKKDRPTFNFKNKYLNQENVL